MIPIAFVQFGRSTCLEMAVKFASNLGHEIYVISDNYDNSFALPGVKYIPMQGLLVGVDTFQKNYLHLSTNGKFNELVCFLRWIVLRNFLAREGISEVIHLDHDVLLYADALELATLFGDYNVSIASMTSGHFLFVTFKVLDEFVEKMTQVYVRKACHTWYDLVGLYNAIKSTGGQGGACDMTLLRLLVFNKMYFIPRSMLETSLPFNFGSGLAFIDDNINSENGCWNMTLSDRGNSLKKVWFRGREAFCFNHHLNTPVRALALHFQGINGKVEMMKFDSGEK